MLAYTKVHPSLKRREEGCLSRIIDRCTGAARKKYDDLRGVLRDLPDVPSQKEYSEERRMSDGRRNSAGKRMSVILAGSAACIGVIVLAGVGRKGIIESRNAYSEERKSEQQAEQQREQREEQQMEQQRKETAWKKETAEAQELLLDEAIEAYGKVLELEQDKEKIKEAGMKKMELEMQKGDYEQALETAGTVNDKVGGSEELEMLIGDCEKNIP